MPGNDVQSFAIACSAGGFKGVFVHGVLSTLEAAGVHADAYAAASSSVFPSICAAIKQADEVGLRYWRSALQTLRQPGNGMSEAVLRSISESGPVLFNLLFQPSTPRFFIVTSAIKTSAGAEQTQGDGARRLGRRLLLSAARGDRSWVDEHLQAYSFDSATPDEDHRLTIDNINEVIYASTRMLHTWTIPAWVAGRPYVDASYTCACPALEMVQQGYAEVIAIATEPGPLYRDIFRSEPIPDIWQGVPIHVIRPDRDPGEMGAGFTDMTEEGMVAVYENGKEKGREFLAGWSRVH
jgi:hypothetical protein